MFLTRSNHWSMLFEPLGFSVSFLLPFMDRRGITEEKLKQQLVKKKNRGICDCQPYSEGDTIRFGIMINHVTATYSEQFKGTPVGRKGISGRNKIHDPFTIQSLIHFSSSSSSYYYGLKSFRWRDIDCWLFMVRITLCLKMTARERKLPERTRND